MKWPRSQALTITLADGDVVVVIVWTEIVFLRYYGIVELLSAQFYRRYSLD